MPAETAYTNVPVVVGVAGVLAVIAGVILYLNKRWCLTGINSLNCCDDTWGIRLAPRPRKTDLGRGFSFEEAGSDSEEDGRRRRLEAELAAASTGQPAAMAGPTKEFAFHRQLQAHYGQTTHAQIPYRSGGPGGPGGPPGMGGSAGSHHHHHHHHPGVQAHQGHHHHQGGGGAAAAPAAGPRHHYVPVHADLMSMAERGCLSGLNGLNVSSNGSTTSGSTTCSEEDKMLRHREGRGQPQPDGQSPVVNFAGCANGSASGAIWPGYPPRYAHRKLEPPLEVVPEPPRDQCDNQDCVVVVNQEDCAASDIQSVQSAGTGAPVRGRHSHGATAAPICACGQLEVAFAYDAPMRNMTIHLLQARDIPARDRGGSTHTQVRILLLPAKKQKCKSKVRHGEQPQFMESFLLNRINPEDVNSMGVRFRLYGCGRMRRERLIGECVVSFAAINLESETNVWLNLEPRANTALKTSASDLLSLARSDSTGSNQSMQLQLQRGGVPELLLGLAYNGTTGRLAVELIKGSHFRNLGASAMASVASLARPAARPVAPDTFVRLRLASSSGQEIARAKSSTRRGQPNPLFKETFVFQVALFQLPDVTLLVSVFNKRSMKKKEAIGWFALGSKSSGEEEALHWNDMCEVRGEQICRWHVLLDT